MTKKTMKIGDTLVDAETGEIETVSREGLDQADATVSDAVAYFRHTSAQDLYLDDLGREVLDPRSMAPPVGYVKQPSMVDIQRAQIQEAIRNLTPEDAETFEEADDFDVNDDFDPNSPYEEIFDPAPPQARYYTAEEQLGFGDMGPGIQRRKPATAPGPLPDVDPPSDGPRPPAERTAAPTASPEAQKPVAEQPK